MENNTMLTINGKNIPSVDVKGVAMEMLYALDKLAETADKMWLAGTFKGDFNAHKTMFFSRHMLKDFLNGEEVTEMELESLGNEFKDLDLFITHNPKAALYPQEVWDTIEVAAKKMAALMGGVE